MAVVPVRIEIDLTGLAFTDELLSSVGASAFTLLHDWFWGGANLEIWTGAGQTGTKLTEGAGDDYVLSVENEYLTTQSGQTVYGKIQVINAAYQAVDLYFNGEYIADSVQAAHINSLQDQITDLGGASDHLTLGGQTVDAGVNVGEPIFFNVTKETIDLCDIADWTDDAEITSSVNTSEFILGNALNLTKDTGANTVASLDKTLLAQIDFTGKSLKMHLYIDDAGTLADLTTLACLVLRYGSSNADYYEWEFDKSELAVGWNSVIDLTSANADSTTGTPVLAAMDYAYLALNTNNAGDTWAAGKAIMDYWFVCSDQEWKLSGEGLPTPTAIFKESSVVTFSGHEEIFSNLIPGQWYWMKADGSVTTIPGEAYNSTRLYYALSDTEAIVAIAVESNDESVTPGLGRGGTIKGFHMGGTTSGGSGGGVNVIEDLIFSNETSQTIAATLDLAKYLFQAGVSSSTKGFVLGGMAIGPARQTVIEDMIFADETSQAIAATLDTAKDTVAGVFSSLKGYVLGGNTGAVTSVIEDLIFADESSQAIAATLDTAKERAAGVTGASKGYVMGGATAAVAVDVIEDFIFADETSQTIAATLDTIKKAASAAFSALKGYIAGGENFAEAVRYDVIEDLIFATETSQAIAAVISDTRSGAAGISSLSKGYFIGGNDGARKTVIDALTFSTETAGAIAATLDTAKSLGAGVQF